MPQVFRTTVGAAVGNTAGEKPMLDMAVIYSSRFVPNWDKTGLIMN